MDADGGDRHDGGATGDGGHDGVDGVPYIPFSTTVIVKKDADSEALVISCNNGRALFDRTSFSKLEDDGTPMYKTEMATLLFYLIVQQRILKYSEEIFNKISRSSTLRLKCRNINYSPDWIRQMWDMLCTVITLSR